MRFPVEIVRRIARGGRAATSSSSTACRCSTWSKAAALGRGRRAGPGASRRPARRSSTPASAGTRRASRPSRPRCRAPPSPGSRSGCMGAVSIPLVTTNRINTPERRRGDPRRRRRRHGVDGAPVARRPGVRRTRRAEGRADEINTCIGCNQACLDHTFSGKIASCLVNPRACHETELVLAPGRGGASASRWSAPGPAGLACAVTAGRARPRGHAVRRGRARSAASSTSPRRIPGKEEFDETLRYFRRQLERTAWTCG